MNLYQWLESIGEKIYDTKEKYGEQLENLGEKIYDTQQGIMGGTTGNIITASTDALGKSVGMFTGGSNQELQAVSSGVAEGTIKSIGAIKDTTKYLAIAGLIVVGLIIYSKLK